MNIYFLRHGETDGNKEKILQGRIDNPLNENGKNQALNARNEIRNIVFDKVYTSPLKRAVETAIIASGVEEDMLIKDERIQEISFGDMEGKQVSLENEKMVNFFTRPHEYEPVNNGESYQSLLERIRDFLNDIAKKYEDNPNANILVVSHGALIHGIIMLIKKLELKDFWVANVANCAVTISEYVNGEYNIIKECNEVDRNYLQEDKKKVVVGMSGGVDSSVAAYLLKEKGYDVIGVTMQMFHDEDDYIVHKDGNCGGKAAVEDARRVAKLLDIPFYVVSFKEEFKTNVMDYFVSEYKNARTPNPCVHCNRYIKFQALLDKAKELGADYIATGHYARIDMLENGRYSVKTSATSKKDQTYVLYDLTQEQLSRTIMPIGEYTKDEIRQIAMDKLGMNIANKPDSQDICFIPDGDYVGFIERLTNTVSVPGNFVDKEGNILGKHKGIVNYTIGQRKGLNLAMGHPVFVVELRPDTNEVVIGENEDIFTTHVYAHKINAMSIMDFEGEIRALGKIRYAHKGAMCTVRKIENDMIECVFDEPQRAVTPGQSLVLYDGEYVMGGGTII